MTEKQFLESEQVDLLTTSDVLPFCVYHWIDPSVEMYRGYLSGPSIIKDEQGKFKYTCAEPNSLNPYGKWSLAFTFYAINPMVRPIPYGMSLFCAKQRDTFPWDTVSIQPVYDPYDINNECVYFTTYTKPVPWTTPLYVHVRGTFDFPTAAFPSLSPNAPLTDYPGRFVKSKPKVFSTLPNYVWTGTQRTLAQLTDLAIAEEDSTEPGWHHSRIFPFYVLSPDLFGPNFEKITFTCHNANCMPHNPNSDYIDRVSVSLNERLHGEKPKPRRLRDCVIRCNQLVPGELGGGHPFDLISLINSELGQMKTRSPSLENKITGTSPIVIAVMVTVLVVSLGVLIYFSLRTK